MFDFLYHRAGKPYVQNFFSHARRVFLFFSFPARGDRPTIFFHSSLSTRVVVDFHATGRPAVNNQSIPVAARIADIHRMFTSRQFVETDREERIS
jgi:hypothetical protein